MSYVERHAVAITTDASGDFTGYTPVVTGRVVQYRYVPDGTVPLDTGADLDVTGEDSGVVIANQDNIGTSAFTKAPRQATHDEAGAASLYAAAGEPVEDYLFIAKERLKIVIAQGGASKKGTLYIWVA
ncbi:MAG TPA: hypothetical protein VNL15_06130 [Dehalococcoidia bacterium]|nr:hypothetical protein [Dehalococcoidia bacterium]